jgi:hypothetical protein
MGGGSTWDLNGKTKILTDYAPNISSSPKKHKNSPNQPFSTQNSPKQLISHEFECKTQKFTCFCASHQHKGLAGQARPAQLTSGERGGKLRPPRSREGAWCGG